MKIKRFGTVAALVLICSGAPISCGTDHDGLTIKSVRQEVGNAQFVRAKPHDEWWRDAIFYQIWPRSFHDTDGDGNGDFRGMEAKLPYLSALGVDAIWLTPILEAPSYHGYDFEDFYRVESDYGTLADLRSFLNAARSRGIRVIADLVINHISSRHPWFARSERLELPYRDYFVWRSEAEIKRHPWQRPWDKAGSGRWQDVWHLSATRLAEHRLRYPDMADDERPVYYYGVFGGSQPDLNFNHVDVRTELEKVAKFWLEQGFAGFRLDAARYLYEEIADGGALVQAESPKTLAYWRAFASFVRSVKPDAYLVGEIWYTNATIAKYYAGASGLDAAFDFSFSSELIFALSGKLITQDKGGILATILRTRDLGRALAHNVETKQSQNVPLSFFPLFLSNHDQERSANQLLYDPRLEKMAATVLLTLPGTPYLYYGEEIGLPQPEFAQPRDFYDDIFKRAPMLWDRTRGAGFTTATSVWVDDPKWVPWRPHHAPWWHEFIANLCQSGAPYSVAEQWHAVDSVLNHYRRVIMLRKQRPELHSTADNPLEFLPGNGTAAVYRRSGPGGVSSSIIANPSAVTLHVDVGTQTPLIDLLTGAQPTRTAAGLIEVGPYQSMILGGK